MADRNHPDHPSPAALGFVGNEAAGWTGATRAGEIHFRILRTLDELGEAERLQEVVFAVTDRDLIPANELVVVEETGGAVIGAFLPGDPARAVGILIGWGGFVKRPRLVSDLMAVVPSARNLGLAEAMKRLQAAIALSRGFEEIVWTVDPLRAANARLNFGKLGAVSRTYELDRYGTGFAADLYGFMPTDRLHVTWEITSARVQALLTCGASQPRRDAQLPAYEQGTTSARMAVAIPADIDAMLTASPDVARAWRLHVRAALTSAFTEGFTIVGFQPAQGQGLPSLVLERTAGKAE